MAQKASRRSNPVANAARAANAVIAVIAVIAVATVASVVNALPVRLRPRRQQPQPLLATLPTPRPWPRCQTWT